MPSSWNYVEPEKFKMAQEKVHFLSYEISERGVEYDPNKIETIQKFPRPRDVKELRSFLGMANQLGGFVRELSMATNPLRTLLKKKSPFIWNEDHEAAFNITKAALLSPPVRAVYDPEKPTRVMTDASRKNGLGFIMQQKHYDEWKLVQAGSRYINETEAGYSMVELELLAVVWAFKKLRVYLRGLSFELIVDHQPLVSILDNQTLDMIDTPRIQRLKEKTAPYVFKTTWTKGATHFAADALSRKPVNEPTSEDAITAEDEVIDTRCYLRAATVCLDETIMPDPHLERVKEATKNDNELQDVIKAVRDENDFPDNWLAKIMMRGEYALLILPYL